jgi:hypothetical protein
LQPVGDIEALTAEIAAWLNEVNERQRGVDWQMRIGDARVKLISLP